MKTHNLFISHSWDYSDEYENLVRLLRDRPYFRFNDYSVPRYDPIHYASNDRELKNAIRQKMQPCGVIVILAGVYATYSRWINIEIDLAKGGFGSPKPIIAVVRRGAERTSQRVTSAADRIVRWNADSVVRAIREVAP